MNESWLIWSVLFGGVGMGMLAYGRRQKAMVPFLAGIVLIGAPYLVEGTAGLLLIGALTLIASYFFKDL